MEYKIKSIPHTYQGVNFRSRLEATWAAFFDVVNWKWEYEPFDLDGWIPDFKIWCEQFDTHLLVEVKPFDFSEKKEVEEVINKIQNACDKEVLLVGQKPTKIDKEMALGYLLKKNSEWGYDKDLAILNYNGHFDISAYYGFYQFRFSREHDGDHHLRILHDAGVEELWKHAKNRVQWQKEKKDFTEKENWPFLSW